MSRFRKLTHCVWHCQYHIIWCPKYRFRVLKGTIADDVQVTLQRLASYMKCEVVELNVQVDHVHMVVMVPPTLSVSKAVGELKGRSAMRIFQKFPYLRKRPYYGNHFWAVGYCVDTVGLDEEKVRLYVRYQEKKEREEERNKGDQQMSLGL
jgi:putative transposase